MLMDVRNLMQQGVYGFTKFARLRVIQMQRTRKHVNSETAETFPLVQVCDATKA
jgi:hypothetical protein